MTRRFLSSLGSIALLGCLTVALPGAALAQNNKVRVHVPFDFQVSGMAMSAGQYYFESPISGGMVYLTAPDGDRHAVISMPIGNPSNPKSPQVVFERLGDRYRLAEVWLTGLGPGNGLRRTKSENEYAKQNGKGSLVALSLRDK
jgi:hypothetical protein